MSVASTPLVMCQQRLKPAFDIERKFSYNMLWFRSVASPVWLVVTRECGRIGVNDPRETT